MRTSQGRPARVRLTPPLTWRWEGRLPCQMRTSQGGPARVRPTPPLTWRLEVQLRRVTQGVFTQLVVDTMLTPLAPCNRSAIHVET